MLKLEMIENFRKYVCEKKDDIHNYLLEHREDKEVIHRWNVLCACIDWIQVYVTVYNNIVNDLDSDNVDLRSGQCMYLVMVSDIIVSNINKLISIFHLIFDETHFFVKSKTNCGEASLYFENDFQNDDLFFKKIRAIFGAHSHDINSMKGKLSCSWPSDEFSNGELDWSVLVYPAIKNEKAFFFGFKINELNDFVEYKYNLLERILEEINFKISKEG